MLTLDVILESQPAPDFVKMDIEAAELLALQGATRLIQEARPVYYIETGDDSLPALPESGIQGHPPGNACGDSRMRAEHLFLHPLKNRLLSTAS